MYGNERAFVVTASKSPSPQPHPAPPHSVRDRYRVRTSASFIVSCNLILSEELFDPGNMDKSDENSLTSGCSCATGTEQREPSGCNCPTGTKQREPGTRNLQTSTFSISNPGNMNKSDADESLSPSKLSSPTRTKRREPGTRNMQTSTFSISKEIGACTGHQDVNTHPVDMNKSDDNERCSSPTGTKQREPGTRNLQTSTFSISNPGNMDKSDESSLTSGCSCATVTEQREPSGCNCPTGTKQREPGTRNMQTSTFSISNPGNMNKSDADESLSPAKLSSPTRTKRREPGTRNMQTSTFSISKEIGACTGHQDVNTHPGDTNKSDANERCSSPTGTKQREPGTRNMQTSTFSISNPGNTNKNDESLSPSGCNCPTATKQREPGTRNMQTSTFSFNKANEQ